MRTRHRETGSPGSQVPEGSPGTEKSPATEDPWLPGNTKGPKATERPGVPEELSEDMLAADPFEQFSRWFEDAAAAGLPQPNAMVLATTSADGRSHARTVLLKAHDAGGFVFYTNRTSRKGMDLAANPWA